MSIGGWALFALLATSTASTASASTDPATSCEKPVYMIVAGVTHDRKRMQAYARAIAESKLYEKLGGYYINAPLPVASFEGEIDPRHATLIVRFPCLANAKSFWNSREYQENIRPLRLNPSAGDYSVTVYSEIPLRSDMVGKVSDNNYLQSFSSHDISQAEEPAH